MQNLENSSIASNAKIKEALEKLNYFPAGSTLFVIDSVSSRVLGTLTDGDIRRGLLKNMSIDSSVIDIMRSSFRFLTKGNYYNDLISDFKDDKIKTIPLIDKDGKLLKIFDLTELKNVLPVDAVIMAGGKGERLKPLTDKIPKPLLPIGSKPIIEHNIDRLASNGIDNFYISVNYLADLIKDYFKNGERKNISIKYIDEDKPLGTIGAVSKITDFEHDHVLVMNSDLLTNIDFADFYKDFIQNNADVAVATIPYKVNIPYAVIETKDNRVKALKEKPSYTYYSNAGIYLIKKNLLSNIPFDSFHNATDFLENALLRADKVISYPILGYWLDVGRPDDYLKAQSDIKHLEL